MKFRMLFCLLLTCLSLLTIQKLVAQEPWSAEQLMQPKELAKKINNRDRAVVIFNVGPAGRIKNSIYIGPTQDEESLNLLKSKLSKLPKNTEVVIYCGCCPFKHCPNVRPAFKLLNEMHFSNAKLLNLSKNLKADWIDEGYPLQD